MLVAIDTSTATASLALYRFPAADPDGHDLLAEQTWQAHRRHTVTLAPALRDLLALQEVEPGHIRAIAVTTGPGSFTGVRIGVSLAKGLALGLPTPPALVGIPTLSVTAAPFLALAQREDVRGVWAVLAAGRGRFNWAVFRPGDLLQRPTAQDHRSGRLSRLQEELRETPGPIWVVGEVPQALCREKGLDHVHVVDPVSGLRRAGVLAWLAAHHLEAGHGDSVESLRPLYLRDTH